MSYVEPGFRTFLNALGAAGMQEPAEWARELDNVAGLLDIVTHPAHGTQEFIVKRFADASENVDNGDLTLVMVQPFRNCEAEFIMLDRRECKVVG